MSIAPATALGGAPTHAGILNPHSGSRVVVIGAGFSGLSAALRLRGAGCAVTVVERGADPGGLVRTETFDGHRFDTGATVLTMPGLIDDALAAVGVDAHTSRARLDLRRVDPSYLTRFADGTDFAVPAQPDALIAAADHTFGGAAATGVRRLLDWLSDLNDVEFDTFLNRNLSTAADIVTGPVPLRDTVRGARDLIRMGATGHLSPTIARFIDDERLRRIFTFQALYAGVPPRRANAIYGVIAHMDVGSGVYYPAAGMGRIGQVLADAFVEAGGELLLNTSASALESDGERVTGVQTTTGRLPAEAVVAATPVATVANLLGRGRPRGPRWRGVRYSPSAVVLHGHAARSVTAGWPGHHHTIDFGAAWDSTFTELTRTPGRLMRDPSFLITRPEQSAATTAAGAREPISILAPCPNLDTAQLPWDSLAGPYVKECLQTLAARGYRGIDTELHISHVDHPGTWARAGLPAGTPFGAAHTVRQTGPLRTPNRWPGLTNLVLSGAETVPGVGIPPTLISGRLAAERLVGAGVLTP